MLHLRLAFSTEPDFDLPGDPKGCMFTLDEQTYPVTQASYSYLNELTGRWFEAASSARGDEALLYQNIWDNSLDYYEAHDLFTGPDGDDCLSVVSQAMLGLLNDSKPGASHYQNFLVDVYYGENLTSVTIAADYPEDSSRLASFVVPSLGSLKETLQGITQESTRLVRFDVTWDHEFWIYQDCRDFAQPLYGEVRARSQAIPNVLHAALKARPGSWDVILGAQQVTVSDGDDAELGNLLDIYNTLSPLLDPDSSCERFVEVYSGSELTSVYINRGGVSEGSTHRLIVTPTLGSLQETLVNLPGNAVVDHDITIKEDFFLLDWDDFEAMYEGSHRLYPNPYFALEQY